MIRVLLCGEGPHDVGEFLPDGTSVSDGWLQPLLRNLIPGEVEFVVAPRQALQRLPRPAGSFRPLPKGHGGKALAAMVRASVGNYDLVVFMVDADSTRKREWSRKRTQILGGFSKIHGPAGVACVPMSASESWLLSDADAWHQLGLDDLEVLPTKPERIWGERRVPTSNHPHQFFRRVCAATDVPDSQATRTQIATDSTPDTLTSRCPVSFAAFADDTRVALP